MVTGTVRDMSADDPASEGAADDLAFLDATAQAQLVRSGELSPLELVEAEGSLAAYVWRFEPSPAVRPDVITYDWLAQQTQTDASTALTKALRQRGWSFVGPTTVYAFMQAMGLVDDHVEDCEIRAAAEAERATVRRPV